MIAVDPLILRALTMAQQWYFQSHGEQFGPIAFRELVELVRTGVVNEGDLVRSSWKVEWQAAESVVGLFHMAGRSPEDLARLYAPPPVSPPPVAELPIDSDEEAAERPDWMARLFEADAPHGATTQGGIPILGPAPGSAEQTGESPAGDVARAIDEPASVVPRGSMTAKPTGESLPPELAAYWSSPAPGSLLSEAIESAVAAADQRRAANSPRKAGRISRFFSRFLGSFRGRLAPDGQGTSLVRSALRIVPAIVCANLVAFAIENWSAQEALRFPSREAVTRQQPAVRKFPLIGECGNGEYMFLMFDLMLVSGAATYYAAGWLESRAEG